MLRLLRQSDTHEAEAAHSDQAIEDLLADPRYVDHPLRAALAELQSRYQEHLLQLEKITRIADGYQSAERQRGLDPCDNLAQRHRAARGGTCNSPAGPARPLAALYHSARGGNIKGTVSRPPSRFP